MTSQEKQRNKIYRLNVFRLIFFLILCALLTASLILIKGLFITILLAFILNFTLRPLVVFLIRLKVPRALAVPLVFFSIIGGLAGLAFWSLPFLSKQFENLKKEFPHYIEKLSLLVDKWQSRFESHVFPLGETDISARFEGLLISLGQTFLQELPSLMKETFLILLLAPFFAYFLVKQELGLTRNLFVLVPNHIFEMVLSLHYKINKQIGLFVRARLLEAGLVGLFVGTGLALVGFPFAVLLGMFASLTNLIPYVGPVIGGIPVLLVALVNNYETSHILLVMGIVVFSQILDSVVLIPILLARIVNLHPLTVIVIIIAGGQFMGVLGMIISIPLVNALKVSAMTVYRHISENI